MQAHEPRAIELLRAADRSADRGCGDRREDRRHLRRVPALRLSAAYIAGARYLPYRHAREFLAWFLQETLRAPTGGFEARALLGLPSPRGGRWHPAGVRRMIQLTPEPAAADS